MVTRRTVRRTHLLRPDAELNELFIYSLAVMAKRHDIAVHAAVLMSTHEHLIVTDRQGRLPCFLQELHRVLALAVKELRKWEGPVWDHAKTSVVELRTPQAVVEKLAYVMANPVAAGLVHEAASWPGVNTRPDELGRATWIAQRPSVYIDADNPCWPERTTLSLETPELLRGSDYHAAVDAELRALENQAREQVRTNGWSFLGAERARRLSPFKRAKSWEPLRSLNPAFAVGRGQREAFLAAVAELREFRRAYRAALERWHAGIRDVLFPAETWLMRCVHAVLIAAHT